MKKKKLSERLIIKILTYFVTVLSFCGAVACGVAIVFMVNLGFYRMTNWEARESVLRDIVEDEARQLLESLENAPEKSVLKQYEDSDYTFWVEEPESGKVVVGARSEEPVMLHYVIGFTEAFGETDQRFMVMRLQGSEDDAGYLYGIQYAPYLAYHQELHLCVKEDLQRFGDLKLTADLVNLGLAWKYSALALGIILVIVFAASFVTQLCCAGHRYGQDSVKPTGICKVPFDVLTAGMLCLGGLAWELHWSMYTELAAVIYVSALVLFGSIFGVGYFLILAVQLKAKELMKRTLVYRVLHYCWKILCAFCRIVKKAARLLMACLPQSAQLALVIAIVLMLEMVVMLIFGNGYWSGESVFAVWVLEKILLIAICYYGLVVLMRLQRGSRALAEGDLKYKVDTNLMVCGFKEHGENLNRIAQGLQLAVEEQMKSERLKTELITNVSHDIKTPLTSIINYAELIAEEPVENERITEYAQVLKRHSARLKKLIEDLMEASKASTGNVEVHMVPCQVGVLLSQTAGEYEQRLQELELELIVRQPEEPVYIMADGKLLWRVFDNLLNNICKYAMRSTRVYLTVERAASGKVLITLKNISRYPLDVAAEDLMERFVRGDRSRNTEGNGLGLSIAQSLTDLQGGELELVADGDLFKAVLTFDELPEKTK